MDKINETGKSYNPFKMRGSWIGIGLGLLIMLYQRIGAWLVTGQLVFGLRGLALGLFLYLIHGFLIGWGIHSLIRRLKIGPSQLTEKSYNPFKMWGSWVGMILYVILIYNAIILTLFTRFNLGSLIYFPLIPFESLASKILCRGVSQCEEILLFTILFMAPIVGFLIGWGVHSLVRRFRK